MEKAVVSLSGGMDSTTVLAKMRGHYEIIPVHFQYGSKHNAYEAEAVRNICAHYKLPLLVHNLEQVFQGFRSNLLSGQGDIPEGHYESESMKQTVVPARNLIFASILVGLAESLGAVAVGLGIHQGDHAIYPDCRPTFFTALKEAVWHGTETHLSLEAPYLFSNKAGILTDGFLMGVPYSLTRTCYKEQQLSCGKCGACQERLEAFERIGCADPIIYEK